MPAALPAPIDPDDDLIPPELAMDEAPIDDDDLEPWIEDQVGAAQRAGVAPAEGMAVLLHRALYEVPVEHPDMDVAAELVATGTMPPSIAAFVTGELDPERMEWALSKMSVAARQLKADRDHARHLHDRIDRWFARRKAAIESSTTFFDTLLKANARRAWEANNDVKTISLPSGKITTRGPRKGNEQEVIVAGLPDSEAQLIEWLTTTLTPRMRADDLAELLIALAGRWREQHGPDEGQLTVSADDVANVIAGHTDSGDAELLSNVVKTTRKVMIGELRKVVGVAKGKVVYVLTGEPVPGTAVHTKERTWTVSPAQPGDA